MELEPKKKKPPAKAKKEKKRKPLGRALRCGWEKFQEKKKKKKT